LRLLSSSLGLNLNGTETRVQGLPPPVRLPVRGTKGKQSKAKKKESQAKMTQVISLVTPSQAMTPAHSPMDSDDYDRPRAFRALPDTPDSPSPRTAGLGRKRAAPINTSDASYGRLERLKLSTPSSMASNEATRDICLCTPAPKIPRPRNGESLLSFSFFLC
jgi:hypothetical protein